MLAPVTEADFGEDELLRLNLESAALWPAFAAELEEATGMPTGYRSDGALVVAVDRGDAAGLRRLHQLKPSLGLQSDLLAPPGARGPGARLGAPGAGPGRPPPRGPGG